MGSTQDHSAPCCFSNVQLCMNSLRIGSPHVLPAQVQHAPAAAYHYPLSRHRDQHPSISKPTVDNDVDLSSCSYPTMEAFSPEEQQQDIRQILRKAGKRALGGGLPGMAAMTVQVVSLMWLRTTVNYQYRYGTSTREALKTLYKDGGVRRFYQGLAPALLQARIAFGCMLLYSTLMQASSSNW